MPVVVVGVDSGSDTELEALLDHLPGDGSDVVHAPVAPEGEEGGEARVVRLKRKRTRKGKKGWGVDMSKLKVDVYPVNGGDGKTCGTLKFRNVRSRSALFGSSHCGSVVFWS